MVRLEEIEKELEFKNFIQVNERQQEINIPHIFIYKMSKKLLDRSIELDKRIHNLGERMEINNPYSSYITPQKNIDSLTYALFQLKESMYGVGAFLTKRI